jgi:hypothetical protein
MVCGPGGEIIVQAGDNSEQIIDLEL